VKGEYLRREEGGGEGLGGGGRSLPLLFRSALEVNVSDKARTIRSGSRRRELNKNRGRAESHS